MVNILQPVIEYNQVIPDEAIGIRLAGHLYLWKVEGDNFVYVVNTLANEKSYIVLESYLLTFLKHMQ